MKAVVIHHPIPEGIRTILEGVGYQPAAVNGDRTVFVDVADRSEQRSPEAEVGSNDQVLFPIAGSTDGASIRPLAVSPRQAARYLGVGHDAIYVLLNQQRLRSVKLGRRRLIPVTELQRFLHEDMA